MFLQTGNKIFNPKEEEPANLIFQSIGARTVKKCQPGSSKAMNVLNGIYVSLKGYQLTLSIVSLRARYLFCKKLFQY